MGLWAFSPSGPSAARGCGRNARFCNLFRVVVEPEDTFCPGAQSRRAVGAEPAREEPGQTLRLRARPRRQGDTGVDDYDRGVFNVDLRVVSVVDAEEGAARDRFAGREVADGLGDSSDWCCSTRPPPARRRVRNTRLWSSRPAPSMIPCWRAACSAPAWPAAGVSSYYSSSGRPSPSPRATMRGAGAGRNCGDGLQGRGVDETVPNIGGC